MRREPKPEFDSYKVFPVYDWPRCCVCNQTFGFETGYEVSFPIRNSVCKKCCGGNQKKADEILRKIKSNSKPNFQSPRQVAIQKRANNTTETNDNNYIIRKEIKCDESYLP